MKHKLSVGRGIMSLLAFFTITLNAQEVNRFPALMAPESKEVKAPANLPAPDFRDKGVLMYGATMQDDLGPLHFAKFYSQDANELIDLARIDPNDDGTRLRRLRLGAQCGDKYYGYIVKVYTYVEQCHSFVTVNLHTGEMTEIREMESVEEREAWPTLYEMTYDITNKKCYALGRNAVTVTSDIYEIDLTTGYYTKVHELDYYAWAMACDYEGNMYIVEGIPDRNNEVYVGSRLNLVDPLNGFAEVSQQELKEDGKPFIPNYTHSMEVYHETNELYWLACNESGYQYIYRVDPKTAAMTRTSALGFNLVVGLAMPFDGADSRLAPSGVKELKVEPEQWMEDYAVRLSWVNPSTTWKGDPLSDLGNVIIARNSKENVIDTSGQWGQEGKSAFYVDYELTPGENTYYVTPCFKNGDKGITSKVTCYFGEDTPAEVSQIELQEEGDGLRISWVKPAAGVHGNKYDEASLTYNVVRLPGAVVVGENLTDTTLLDSSLGDYGTYSYEITPFTKLGEGTTAVSETIKTGKPFTPTFIEDFATQEQADRWLNVNDYGGYGFEYNEAFQKWYSYTLSGGANDDWLISPPIELKAGKTYRVTYKTEMGSVDDFYSYAFCMGAEQTSAGQTVVLSDHNHVAPSKYYEQTVEEVTASVEKDGKYYFSIHHYSKDCVSGKYVAIFGFEIEELFDNDLLADGLDEDVEIMANAEIETYVRITNNGGKAQDKYEVQVLDVTEGTPVVLGTGAGLSVKPGETVKVPVKIKVAEEGERLLAASVILEGDAKEENNQSEPQTFVVQPEGTVLWNRTISGENEAVYTTVPMSFMNEYSTNEMVYRASELGSKPAKIHRIAFEYDDNSLAKETDNVNVKVYMALVDKDAQPTKPDVSTWMTMDQLTLVYEGEQNVKPGKGNKMEFSLNAPFEYDGTQNLVIQVWKESMVTASTEMFPALFKVFNQNGKEHRTLSYSSKANAFQYESKPGFFTIPEIPKLYLAMEEATGIVEHVLGSDAICYDAESQNLLLKDVKRVSVLDLSGRLMLEEQVENCSSLALQLPSGVYIVKAVCMDGAVATIKIVQ